MIRVQVSATGFGRSSFEMIYRMSDRDTGVDVALVKTGMAFFDYDRKKIVAMPADYRERLATGLGG